MNSALLRRLNLFNERVPLTDADVLAIVELQGQFMQSHRAPAEWEVEACSAWFGADANKVMLWFYARRSDRIWWRWVGSKPNRQGGPNPAL